jgi:hypothetical protein
MAKKGLYSDNVQSVLGDIQSTTGWALCIGAGTSVPMFPSWGDLVAALVERKSGKSDVKQLSKNLLDRFSPDALIQAAYNILSLSEDEFIELLSNELYANVKRELNNKDWNIFEKAQLVEGPASLNYDDWSRYDQICSKYFEKCSSYSIAKVIVEAFSKNVAPTDILSFNGENILFSFLNLFFWKKYIAKNGKKPAPKGELAKHFDFIIQSISSRNNNRIPYILCHGLLPISAKIKHQKKRLGGISKLVFAETAYLQLSNSSFSWQSSSFLDVCAKRRVLFIGVSLSDPNMRRWLSWLYENRVSELSAFSGKKVIDSTNHYWINKWPGDHIEASWIESAVSHLGVRLVWLNEWTELEQTLLCMLGL